MAIWSSGLVSPGFCSETSLPDLWNACIKNCSYGVNREVFLRGFRRVIVFSMGPYSCWLLRIWRAYADCGLLFFMYRVRNTTPPRPNPRNNTPHHFHVQYHQPNRHPIHWWRTETTRSRTPIQHGKPDEDSLGKPGHRDERAIKRLDEKLQNPFRIMAAK